MNARGFPAFPAGVRKGRRFATTWWGNAWIKALEDTSLDHSLLTKGRRYAHVGRVGSITVSPGRIAAPVHDTDDEPYETQVFIDVLSDAEWDRFLDQVAAKAGHLAALLDREMPRDLVQSAEDAGVKLLPGIGDLEPDCECPDWGHPCKHAAAVCYQASWLLDADPFVLLLLRGRDESEVLDALRDREGEAGPDGEALAWLSRNASTRARELVGAGRPDDDLDLWEDTVRIAAAEPGLLSRLREASGRADLERAARAWRYGGRSGLSTLETAWTPAPHEVARARTTLEDDGAELEVHENRWTGDGVQVRLGRDGRWYPYRREGGEWWPAAPPAADPVTSLANCE